MKSFLAKNVSLFHVDNHTGAQKTQRRCYDNRLNTLLKAISMRSAQTSLNNIRSGFANKAILKINICCIVTQHCVPTLPSREIRTRGRSTIYSIDR